MRTPLLRLLFVSVALLCSLSARAQKDTTSSIVGRAIEPRELRTTLPNGEEFVRQLELPASLARIELISQGDTLRDSATQTGNFNFKKLKPGPVHLTVTYRDFEPFSESFELMPGENVVIVMFQKKAEQLEAAVVKADKPVVTQHGDTLIYHADAVIQREGDYAMDLLKQFPGVEVSENGIKVTGKAVKRSYVNGALIFGLDPMAPMEYLKGDEVITMNVYDEANPQDRLDGRVREKDRVIDIITKNPIFSTMDLQLRGIAGADQQPKEDGSPQLRYTVGANAHFFSELRQFQADVVTGNVGMHSSNINMAPGPISTNMDNTDFKLGYNRYWQSSLYGNSIQLAYTFGHQKTKNRSHVLREYFETAGTPARDEENENLSTRLVQTHGFNTSANYRTGKHFNVSWNQALQLSRNQNDQSLQEQISIAGGAPMLRDQSSYSANRSWTLQEQVSLGFVSKNQKPLPRITLSMRLGRDNLDAWDLDTLASSYSKRYLTKAGNGLSQHYSAEISQTLFSKSKTDAERQRSKTLNMTGKYNITYSSQNKLQEAYDLYGTPSPLLNAANTYDFTYSSLINTLELQSLFFCYGNNDSFTMMFNLAGEVEKIIDRERIPSYEPEQKTYFRLRPMVNIGFKSWTLSYNSATQTPSVEQIRHRVNDTNPLSLIAGNPDLKQSYIHNLSLGWSKRNITKHSLSGSLSARMTTDPIVSKTLFYAADEVLSEYDNYKVKAGSTLRRSENADYGLSLSASFTAMSQWGGKWKLATQLLPTLSYSLNPQYFGQVLDRTTEWTPGLRASGTFYPVSSVMVGLNSNLSYIRAWNQSGSLDNRAFRGVVGCQVEASFLKIAFITGDYSWNLYKDFTVPAMGSDVHRLNLSLGVGLLKNKALKIAISGVDLLRGGTQYNVTVGPSSITRTWTPVYGRYFIIDISYRFNNTSPGQGIRGFSGGTLMGRGM